jgi:glucose uptake protein
MFIVNLYGLAVEFCFITMSCWGSWANSAKCTTEKWQFSLYYWNYSLGLVLTVILLGITMGSIGTQGRSFITKLGQVDFASAC